MRRTVGAVPWWFFRRCSATDSSTQKLDDMASSYAQLTIKEVSILQRLIFKKLGHSDEFYEKALLQGMGGGGGGSGPSIVVTSSPTTEQAAPPTESPPPDRKKVEKTSFDVSIVKFDPTKKSSIIKEFRSFFPGKSLIDCKAIADKCPGIVVQGVGKDDAEKLKAALEQHGAEVKLS